MKVCINFRHPRNKNIICETKSFYILLAFLLNTIVLLVAVSIYCYLIKYKAKKTILRQKQRVKRSFVLIVYYKNGE